VSFECSHIRTSRRQQSKLRVPSEVQTEPERDIPTFRIRWLLRQSNSTEAANLHRVRQASSLRTVYLCPFERRRCNDLGRAPLADDYGSHGINTAPLFHFCDNARWSICLVVHNNIHPANGEIRRLYLSQWSPLMNEPYSEFWRRFTIFQTKFTSSCYVEAGWLELLDSNQLARDRTWLCVCYIKRIKGKFQLSGLARPSSVAASSRSSFREFLSYLGWDVYRAH
jgi:hypothetical protein